MSTQHEFSFNDPDPENDPIVFAIDEESITIYPAFVPKWELCTLRIIMEFGPIHQREIVRKEKWMGCHPRWEKDIGLLNTGESTMRMARQLVSNLRLKHSAPILSGVKGYWIGKTKKELAGFIEILEGRAKAESASFLRTYRSFDALIRRLKIKRSDYFDGFDDDDGDDSSGPLPA
jgi:hypothetical protein